MKKFAVAIGSCFMSVMLMIAPMLTVMPTMQQGTANENYSASKNLPQMCLQYIRPIEDEIIKGRVLNIQDHTYILLAIMAQESGCDSEQTSDVFQASESLGLAPNTLNTASSIAQGVRYFGQGYAQAKELGLSDIRFVIQGYNFGYGFLSFVQEQSAASFKEDLAVEFAATKGGNYGDTKYVAHVLHYLEVAAPITTDGVFGVVPLVGSSVTMTQPYGQYFDGSGSHWGIDITSGFGSIVVAADGGEVVEVHGGYCPDWQGLSSSCGGGYGNGVTIKHSNGLYARYGHMQEASIIVHVGDQVAAGAKLGLEGSSGRSTGSHLHFEVRVAGGYHHGDTRDPLEYIVIPGVNG